MYSYYVLFQDSAILDSAKWEDTNSATVSYCAYEGRFVIRLFVR